MKRTLTTLLLATVLAGGAIAQTAPVGGPDAKGNSAVKARHTVNDGSAKPAANSFTQNQAMKHIQNSGYTGVSGLTKGSDGVWRGSAMKNGAPVNVAMDFKGNVTEGMSPTRMTTAASRRHAATPPSVAAPVEDNAAATSAPALGSSAAMANGGHHRRHHGRRHHHHRHHGGGVGMSGVDRNKNGVSDKEDRALSHQ